MENVLTQDYMIWFLAGFLFFILEFIIPGVIIMFFGIGAWCVVIVLLLFDLPFGIQLFIFLTTSVASLLLLRKKIMSRWFSNNNDNNPDEEFIGGQAEALETFGLKKYGKVSYKGTSWIGECSEEVHPGDKLEIIRRDGLRLILKPWERS